MLRSIVLLLLVLRLGVARAEADASAALDDRIPGSTATFADAVRLIAPDLHAIGNGKYEGSCSLRSLFGAPAHQVRFTLQTLTSSSLEDSGSKRLLILLEAPTVEGGFPLCVLACYRLTPALALIDAVDVTRGPHVSLQKERLAIGAGRTAFLLDNWHDNSSESFQQLSVAALDGRRLRLLLDLPAARGVARYADGKVCKTSASYRVGLGATSSHGYRDLRITFDERKVCHRPSEKWDWNTGIVKQTTRHARASWDPTRRAYRPPSLTRR